MGLSINDAVIFAEWAERHRLSGRIGVLGVPKLFFSARQFSEAQLNRLWAGNSRNFHAAEYFGTLGFKSTSFIDISDYEGADVVFDLGANERPSTLEAAFDTIFDCGTLEHVFNIPNALANIRSMIPVGGVVVHFVCMNNGVDHGFYQLSPTLFFDYYEAAGFELLKSAYLSFDAENPITTPWTVRHVRRGTFSNGALGTLDGRTSLYLMAARKISESPNATIPDPIHLQTRA